MTVHSSITMRLHVINDTRIQNLILILEEHEVTVEINEVPEAIHNRYTCSTSSYRPESMFIRTTLIVPYVGVIGFG